MPKLHKLVKKALCLICAAAVLCSAVLPAGAYSASNWAKEDMDKINSLGLIPEILQDADLRRNVTRKEMCYIAVAAYEKINGSIPDTDKTPFTDTTDQIIENAWSVCLVSGMGDGTYAPNDYLTRQQLFVMIINFLECVGWKYGTGSQSDLVEFQDADRISSWAMEATRNAVGLGLVNGDGSRLKPRDNTSIQEALLMYYRTYTYAVEWKAIQEGDSTHLEQRYPGISKWALAEIQAMDSMGMIPTELRGKNITAPMTRREMCHTAVLAYEHIIGAQLAPSVSSPFTDVNDPDITVAAQLGIVSGMGDGTFAPDAYITREQFFKLTVNFMNSVGYPYSDEPNENLSAFSDRDSGSKYAKGPTQLLVSLGIVKGADGRLNYRKDISSQEALVLFYRAYDYLLNEWEFMHEPEEPTEPTEPDPTQPTDPAPTEPPVKPPSDEVVSQKGADLVALARKYLGYNYVWGGKDPSTGFDCSGFVYYLYKQFGVSLYRTANDQWLNGKRVSKSELAVGDLVFFSERQSLDYISHVGIYIGNGQIIHAANSRDGVIISDLSGGYYTRTYVGARRIFTS